MAKALYGMALGGSDDDECEPEQWDGARRCSDKHGVSMVLAGVHGDHGGKTCCRDVAGYRGRDGLHVHCDCVGEPHVRTNLK